MSFLFLYLINDGKKQLPSILAPKKKKKTSTGSAGFRDKTMSITSALLIRSIATLFLKDPTMADVHLWAGSIVCVSGSFQGFWKMALLRPSPDTPPPPLPPPPSVPGTCYTDSIRRSVPNQKRIKLTGFLGDCLKLHGDLGKLVSVRHVAAVGHLTPKEWPCFHFLFHR